MNQQPDKLFRDKLENFQRPVPTSAWDRIAASQGQKKTYSGWLKFAASLLLVAGAGALWLSLQPGMPSASTAAENTAAVPHASQPASQSSANETAAMDQVKRDSASAALHSLKKEHATTKGNITSSVRATSPSSQPHRQALQERNDVGQQPTTADQAPVTGNVMAMRSDANQHAGGSQPLEVGENDMHSGVNDTHAVTRVAPVATGNQSVTLTYSTDDVSAYLDKNIGDEATDDDKKQSTLKKLLQKANDLKTNQDPFGELRQRKNEILALNFKNDKRGQKTRN